MQSVREWAAARGYAYEFVDDALFDFLPAHIRNNAQAPLLPKTDIARLGLLNDRLAQHYERAVWLDADILVFDPEAFTLPEACGAMFCHEIWTSRNRNDEGALVHQRRINNALMIFERAHPLLNFLRYASVELYEHGDPAAMSPAALGTTLLSKLGRILPLRLHPQVACLNPILLNAAYYGNRPEWLHAHAQQHGYRFCAANLCRSMQVATSSSRSPSALNEDQMQALVERLIATRGRVLFGEPLNA